MEKQDEISSGITSQKSTEKTASVMKRLFRAPNPKKMIIPTIVLSLFYGFITGFDVVTITDIFLIYGIILFAIPAYLSAFLSKYIAESLGGILYYRRSMLLSFITLLIIGFIILILKFSIIPLYSVRLNVIIIFAHASTLWLRHIILVTTSNSNNWKSLPVTLIQPIVGIIILSMIRLFIIQDWLFMLSFFIIFLLSILIFIKLVNSPMKKNFNWDGLELMSHMLSHITEGKSTGVRELEKFFLSFSEKMDVTINVIGFKIKDKIKALMIVPYIHPGPFGSIGGGNLPYKLYQNLKNISNNIFVPHSATNHDYNMVSSDDTKIIVKIIKNLVNEMKYQSGGSRFIRCHDNLDICAQQLGNSILLIHTSSPNPTDDIDPAIGQIVSCKIEDIYKCKPIFIDAHNCLEKGTGCVFFNTPKSEKIIELSIKASNQISKNKIKKIKIGCSQRKGFDIKEDSIGNQGIQVLTIESDTNRNTYILFDGNNMVKGLREKIVKEIKKLVYEVEVLTSDNHVVNVRIGGYNPIGQRKNHNDIIKIVRELVKESISDLEEVDIGSNKGLVKGISLFGSGNTARLSSTINSIVSSLKINTILTLSLAVLLSIFIYLVTTI